MTSAPNLRQPSNGNKLTQSLLPLLVLMLFFSGCELFKPLNSGTADRTNNRTDDRTEEQNPEPTAEELDPIQSRRVFDPETGTYVYVDNAPTEEMDTVRWRLISEFEQPPITEEGTEIYAPRTTGDDNTSSGNSNNLNPIQQTGTTTDGSRLLTAYNVDFVLPFLSNRLGNATGDGNPPSIDDNSLWALHFYSGAQMALDDLANNQINLNVTAQDSRANANRTKQLQTTPALRNAHLIIGPYLRANVATLAEQVRNREQVLISPYSAAGGISTSNPNYVQVNPTLETHCRNILQHVLNTQNADQIVLVAGPEQINRFGIFQEEYKVLSNNVDIAPLPELVVEDN
ncbi:MAG: hypothetical protein AAFU03_11110, partial [Bacteroidota bacterium]